MSHAYPTAWQRVDSVRAACGSGVPQWPDWCFLPYRHVHAIATGGCGQLLPYERSHHPSMLGALAAWRVTQGIYRFDPALYEAVINTPLDRDLPREPLYRLPEWCVYIETSDLIWRIPGEERPIHGAWAHLDLERNIQTAPECELRLVLDTARAPGVALDPTQGCVPVPLTLMGKGTIADSLERVLTFGADQAIARGLKPPAGRDDAKRVARMLWPIVSLLLYICTESAEIGDGIRRALNPRPTRTRYGWRLFPPNRPTTWDVGVRIGAKLRRACQHDRATDTARTGRHVRPHVRIAHSHTFLVGTGRAERCVKWLPVIPVNMDSPNLLAATIRRVE